MVFLLTSKEEYYAYNNNIKDNASFNQFEFDPAPEALYASKRLPSMRFAASAILDEALPRATGAGKGVTRGKTAGSATKKMSSKARTKATVV